MDPSAASPATGTVDAVDELSFEDLDGPHNAEALMVDPRSGDLVIVTKELDGAAVLAFFRVLLLAQRLDAAPSVSRQGFAVPRRPGLRAATSGWSATWRCAPTPRRSTPCWACSLAASKDETVFGITPP